MGEKEKKVRKFIVAQGLLIRGARVVVGLSGGADSVCLALMLHRLGHEVVAVHCNFQLRGAESERDEQFVKTLCQQQGWTLHLRRFDTERHARQHHQSIEMAARELRYAAFRQVKEEAGVEAIAVGHHQDDNTETLLLNLVRGTGLRGLCGMQPRQGDIVRPLLCLTRQEIEECLHEWGQPFVTDHTNLEDAFARNKVRLHILPQMEAINPAAQQNITTALENLNEVQKVYQQAMQKATSQCCQLTAQGDLCISIRLLRQLASPLSLLHEVLSPLGFHRKQQKDILESLEDCGKVFMANGRRLLVDRHSLMVEAVAAPIPPVPPKPTDETAEAASPAAESLHPQIRQSIVPVEQVCIRKDTQYAYLDADKLHGPLSVRTPQPGDTFAPFGMQGHRKLLSDYLTDQKLSLFEKEKQHLLLDGAEIAWVVGRRSSDLYRVDETTRRVMVLQYISCDDAARHADSGR